MSYDRLKEVADKVVARQESVRGKGEQATRQAMILPFLEALGYDAVTVHQDLGRRDRMVEAHKPG